MVRRRSSLPPRVRMYRQGLGDCFLVSLPGASNVPCHMLIDCGVHEGTSDGEKRMNAVALDIEAQTGGRLDIVVASHEHWDHLSGFLLARPVFDRMMIGEVWMPWTADPSDPRAEAVRSQHDHSVRGLRVIANRLAQQGSEASLESASRLRSLLGLFGSRSALGTRAALEYLREHPSGPRVRYLRPSDKPERVVGSDSSRAYVLGPECNGSPDGSTPGGRPASTARGSGASLALFVAAGQLPLGDDDISEFCQAFDGRYRIAPELAEAQPFFRQHYLKAEDSWRGIGSDWMVAAEPVALALDRETNDRSLALAIEIEPGGRVLLFPSDAQTAQWAAWDRLVWPTDEAPTKVIGMADLLSRTVLLQVGLHGAAMAMPTAGGLDRMANPTLVALCSGDASFAAQQGWRLPCPGLLERLQRATRGRILRSDQPLPERPDGVTKREWDDFRAATTIDPAGLFIDYTLLETP